MCSAPHPNQKYHPNPFEQFMILRIRGLRILETWSSYSFEDQSPQQLLVTSEPCIAFVIEGEK